MNSIRKLRKKKWRNRRMDMAVDLPLVSDRLRTLISPMGVAIVADSQTR
jgi:hypothetical protein